MLIWTHCDTDDRVPGWRVEVFSRPGNVVIMKQGHHMRQGGEGDISHAVGLLDVNDHFSHLLPKKRSFEGKKKSAINCLQLWDDNTIISQMIKFITALELFQIHSRDISPFSLFCFFCLLVFTVNLLFSVKRFFDSNYSREVLLSESAQKDSLHLSETELDEKGSDLIWPGEACSLKTT